MRDALPDARVVFWQCPISAHHHSYPEPIRETVRWIDNVAHCMEPGCDRTSINPVRKGDRVRYWPGLRPYPYDMSDEAAWNVGSHISVAESDVVMLGENRPPIAAADVAGNRVVYLRRVDKDGHMDAIGVAHVEVIDP